MVVEREEGAGGGGAEEDEEEKKELKRDSKEGAREGDGPDGDSALGRPIKGGERSKGNMREGKGTFNDRLFSISYDDMVQKMSHWKQRKKKK